METDPEVIWQNALRALSQQVSRANYDTWLEGTKGLRLEGSALVVGTRSEFVTEWLQKRLRPLIIRTLADLSDESLEIRFEPLQSAIDEPQALRGSGNDDARTTSSPSLTRPRLRDRYTFDTFIVGPSNRLAHAAAEGCVSAPGRLYNPVFLYGGNGLGKTHLLHAIGHQILKAGLSVACISAEQFTGELITAIQQRRQEEFRNRYRFADALLIDDIQFIAGREQTQSEFFHTFNDLYEAGHQIVLTSDKNPSLITELEERLRTRFEWGLIADIQAPDMETRVAILRAKASEQQATVPDNILHLIAGRFINNIRELEGSLTRVLAYAKLSREPLSPGLVQSALASLAPKEPRLPPSPEVIMDSVCRYFSLTTDDLMSKSREKRVAYPRQIAMYLMRELAHRSLVEIGTVLGNRDHSTVHHGWRKMERSLAIDPETQRDITSLREMVDQARDVA